MTDTDTLADEDGTGDARHSPLLDLTLPSARYKRLQGTNNTSSIQLTLCKHT